MPRIKTLLISSTLFIATLAPALAQEPAKPANAPPPVSSVPERTTASFGDWILRCDGGVAGARRACEVALLLTAQAQTAPIAQVAIGREPLDRRPITIVLPHNVSLTARPQIALAKDARPPLDFTWQRCTPGACFAAAILQNDAVTAMNAQTEAGKIVYKTAAEQDIALPFSTRGLAQALAAMAKEP